jgi:type I restriction enzyme S subunit
MCEPFTKWKFTSLRNAAEKTKNSFIDGDWIEAPYITDSGIRLIQTGNIGRGYLIEKTSSRKYISKQTFQELRCSWVHSGDILICRLADPIGRACNVPDGLDKSVTSVDVTIMRVNREEFHPRFVLHYLNSDRNLKKAADIAGGSTRSRISRTNLGSLNIPTPPLPQQQKIAQVLDTLDTQIQKTEALITKLEKIKEGLLHDLLTRGIDQNGQLRPVPEQAPELYKESALGLIPKVWEIRQLQDVASVERGQFTHRPRNDPKFYGGPYPFIQTGDIARSRGKLVSSYSQTLSSKGLAASKRFPAGTIAVTIAANIADSAILALPMYFPDSVVGIIPADGISTRFIELCIRRAKPRLDARAPQSAQKNINLQDLRPLQIPVPNQSEQQLIAETYESIARRIAHETGYLSKLTLQKVGLMDDLLTGRVRVTSLLSNS